MTQLNEAVVLITGAAGGFGQELTRQLLAAGSQLILSDLDTAMLQSWVDTIQDQATPGKVLDYIPVDLATREGCEILFNQVQQRQGPIDILINNAGIAFFGRTDEIPPEKWERLMQVNLLAPMRLSTLFVAEMIARRQGHIVNISSLAGWTAPAGLTAYATSKFGLRGFSEGLFQEVKSHNVQVTAVYPFFSRTPILKSERFGTLAKEVQDFPEQLATDPTKVIRAAIAGIRHNQLQVFPDGVSRSVYLFQRCCPELLGWIQNQFTQRLKHG